MSPDSKKSRYSLNFSEQTVVSTVSRVTPSELESDGRSEVSEQSEAERESGTSSKASSRAPSECVGGFDGDGLQRRSLTPPIQFDEAEINRKVRDIIKFTLRVCTCRCASVVQLNYAFQLLYLQREESLNSLKAVFSPKGDEKKPSNRRKLPVFCATGTKPHLVSTPEYICLIVHFSFGIIMR